MGKSSCAFAPILFAQGALLAGLIASRVLYEGRGLMSFKLDVAGSLVFFLLVVLGPLTMFTAQLDHAKRQGRAEYGLLANRYVFGFEDKWIRGGTPDASELLETGELRSMADLAETLSLVREMRIVPFGFEEVILLAAATAAPLLPLVLTVVSLEDLVGFVLRVVFR